MLRRQMMPFHDFINGTKDIHGWDWKVQPWWLLSWAFKQFGILSSSTSAKTLPTGHLVVLANVERASSQVLGQTTISTNEVNRIYPMSTFRAMAGRIMGLSGQLTDNDLAVLLTHLYRVKGAIVYDAEVVKFKAAGDVSKALSMEDKTIASLKALISDLNGQIDTLSSKIESLTVEAQAAATRKDRATALTALKSRKLKESVLSQRNDTLTQVEEVLQRIEQAQDQVTMVTVMKASTSVLRNLRNQAGGIDEVETIVEDLSDEMQQVDEVGKALEAEKASDAIDEDVIDEELEQMLGEAKAKDEEQEAQATQRRLAEIEGSKALIHEPKERGKDSVDPDVAGLKRLSIEEPPSRSDHQEAAPIG